MSEPSAEEPCVLCGKPAVERYRPFCSKRCADRDLHRWLVGSYAIPADPDEREMIDEDGEGGAGHDGRTPL